METKNHDIIKEECKEVRSDRQSSSSFLFEKYGENTLTRRYDQ